MGHITSVCCQDSRKHHSYRTPTTKSSLNQRLHTENTDDVKHNKEITRHVTQQPQNPQAQEQKINSQMKIICPDLNLTHVLGRGSFGQVLLGEFKDRKIKQMVEKCVIKRIQINITMQSSMYDQLQLQRKIMYQSSSRFITKLYYAYRDKQYFYIVMEWAAGGDTFSLIRKKLPHQKTPNPRLVLYKKAEEQALRFIIGCLILGLEYLHQKNIIYRDLKPENLLIFSDGYVKLGDFGLAKQLKESELALTLVGTPVYYAPQVTLRKPYGREVDLWALGVYCYEMSNYILPFSPKEVTRKQKVQQIVRKSEKNRFWKNDNLSSELKDFIDSLLKFDPKKRLGANGWNQLKNHSFFSNFQFDWQALEQGRMVSPLKSIIDSHEINYSPFLQQRIKDIQKSKANSPNRDVSPQ